MSVKDNLQNTSADIEYPEDVEGESDSQVESQTTNNEGQDETENESARLQDSEPGDNSGEGEEGQEEPFHKNPAFKKRVGEIEHKYSEKAKNWDYVQSIAQRNPQLAVILVGEMEKDGKVKAGTTEIVRRRLGLDNPNQQEKQPEKKKEEGTPDISKAIEEHPDVKFARELREKEQRRREEQEEQAENFLQSFETKHPEIAQTANPGLTRRRIAAEAQALIDSGTSFEEAMEEAAQWILHRDDRLENAKREGKIDGALRNVKESSTSLGGSGAKTKTRKLDDEETRAMELMGIKDPDEYLRLTDSDYVSKNI